MTRTLLIAHGIWLLLGAALIVTAVTCDGDSCGDGAWWGSVLALSLWGVVEAVLLPASIVVVLIALANRLPR